MLKRAEVYKNRAIENR